MRACRSRLVIAVRPGAGSGLLSQVLRQYSGPESELVSTRQRADAVRQGIAGAALVCVGSDDLTGLQGGVIVKTCGSVDLTFVQVS